MKLRSTLLLAALATTFAGAAAAQPVLMSPEWAQAACLAWNRDAVLTDKLAESGWVKNDKGRGYKVMQVFRTDCGEKPTAEMRIALKSDKAMCVYGGKVETAQLDSGADYVMSATSARWLEMGRGEYGPMKAMMFGRLGFSGPKMEAMGNMGPFENFLLLVGKVPGSTQTCPSM
jgi:putative sterol carrier protein